VCKSERQKQKTRLALRNGSRELLIGKIRKVKTRKGGNSRRVGEKNCLNEIRGGKKKKHHNKEEVDSIVSRTMGSGKWGASQGEGKKMHRQVFVWVEGKTNFPSGKNEEKGGRSRVMGVGWKERGSTRKVEKRGLIPSPNWRRWGLMGEGPGKTPNTSWRQKKKKPRFDAKIHILLVKRTTHGRGSLGWSKDRKSFIGREGA